MNTRIKLFSLAIATLIALATSSSAQLDVAGWGRVQFNSAWNHETFVQIDAAQFHTLALRPDGSAVGWGSNFDGELIVPPLPPGVTYTKVVCSKGWYFSLGLRSDGSIVAWGNS